MLFRISSVIFIYHIYNSSSAPINLSPLFCYVCKNISSYYIVRSVSHCSNYFSFGNPRICAPYIVPRKYLPSSTSITCRTSPTVQLCEYGRMFIPLKNIPLTSESHSFEIYKEARLVINPNIFSNVVVILHQ